MLVISTALKSSKILPKPEQCVPMWCGQKSIQHHFYKTTRLLYYLFSSRFSFLMFTGPALWSTPSNRVFIEPPPSESPHSSTLSVLTMHTLWAWKGLQLKLMGAISRVHDCTCSSPHTHTPFASSVVPSVSAVWPLVAQQPWPHSLHSLWPSCRAYCEEFSQIRFFPSVFFPRENVNEPVIHTRLIFLSYSLQPYCGPPLIYLGNLDSNSKSFLCIVGLVE